jgi:hypothetical protein
VEAENCSISLMAARLARLFARENLFPELSRHLRHFLADPLDCGVAGFGCDSNSFHFLFPFSFSLFRVLNHSGSSLSKFPWISVGAP